MARWRAAMLCGFNSHIEISKAPDNLCDLNLFSGVAAITGLRIDLCGLEKSRLMIVTKCFHR
jgi:hypothetical protein